MGLGPGSGKWAGLWEKYQQALGLGQLERYRQRRWQRAGEFAGWLTEPTLPSLAMEQAESLYWGSGGSRTREFKTNLIDEVRESLDFLLFDNLRLEGRFEECAAEEGAYKLAGAGKEFASYVLCLKNPSLFAVWNAHAERALRLLGVYPKTLRTGPLGVRYMDLLESLQPVGRQLGLTDFRDLDEFAYAVTRTVKRTAG